MNLHLPDDPQTSDYLLSVVDTDEPTCPRCSLPMPYCECRDVKDPRPLSPREQAWRAGVDRANRQVQAPITVDGEPYVIVSDAAHRCGFSAGALRNFVQSGELTKRGIRYVVRPRHDGDKRSPVYLCLSDLPKLVHKPHGRKKGT